MINVKEFTIKGKIFIVAITILLLLGIIVQKWGIILNEYLKVFISWPVAIIVLCVLFREELAEFIKGDWRYKSPRGDEIERKQPSSVDKTQQKEVEEISPKEKELIAKYISNLER